MDDSKKIAERDARPWADSAYYERAEQSTDGFWTEGTKFRQRFDRLDLTSVIELACGHGRHTERAAPLAGRLIAIDVFEENLQVCRERLSVSSHVEFVLGDGVSFEPEADASASSIFCYDAMVHFAPQVVERYLQDAHRVLRPGGMALFHHSNLDTPNSIAYGRNPGARNPMTRADFNALSLTAGLEILDAIEFRWGGN